MSKHQSNRVALQNKLLTILPNVYFQPPENVKLTYPCIIYKLEGGESGYADDDNWFFRPRYGITYLTKEIDFDVLDQLLKLKSSQFDRGWITDNVHHLNFIVYFYNL